MAENKTVAQTQKLDVKFRDNAAITYAADNLIKASVSGSMMRKYEKQTVMTQSGGENQIYAVLGELTGEGTISMDFSVRDIKNTTDVTLYEICRQLYMPLTAFVAPMASWASTNPLPDKSQLMLDMVLTFHDLGGVGTDQVWVGAVYVKELSDMAPDGQFYKFSVTFGVVEEWV